MSEQRRHKVAFIGTSCTGKTSLCEALSSDHGVVIVPEAARQYFSEHSVDPIERFSEAVQSKIQDLVVENERQAERFAPDNIVCDRSVLDAVVYTKYGGNDAGAEHMFRYATEFLPSYTKLLVLDPHDVPYRQDSIRTESASTRMAIHDLFLTFLEHHAISFELVSGSIPERLKRVRGWLRD